MSDQPEMIIRTGPVTARPGPTAMPNGANAPIPEVPEVPGAIPSALREQIIARRDAQRASMRDRSDFHGGIDEEEAAEASRIVNEYEPVESLELVMPDGTLILYGPPKGISLSMRLIRMFGDANWTSATGTYFRVLMCVQAINGDPVRPISSRIEGEKLANKIGDVAMEYLIQIHAKYWAANNEVDLLVVKKNFT
jgi:hypothetical protein